MFGYIYKTTNLVNNKIYIGQHKHSNFDKKYYGSGKILKKAITKYGLDNFRVELIRECNNQKELNYYEKKYIKYFNSLNSDIGYNIAEGSVGGDTFHMLSKEDQDKKRKLCSLHNAMKNNPEVREKRRITMKGNHYPKMSHDPWNKGLTKEKDDRVLKNALHSGLSRRGKPAWNKGLTKETCYSLMKTSNTLKGNQNGKNNKSTKGYVKINNGIKNTCVKKDELQNYLNSGWKKGALRRGHVKTYNSKFILCVNNGKIYNSISHIISEIRICPASIKKILREGKPIKGYLFQYYEQ